MKLMTKNASATRARALAPSATADTAALASVLPALAIALALALALALAPAPAAKAQDSNDALINLLMQKGVLSTQDAQNVRAELKQQKQQQAATAAAPAAGKTSTESKLKLFPGLTELNFFGDMRLRYEYLNATKNADPNDHLEMNRARYRLRLGFTGKFVDGWFFGARLETANSDRSTNVTMGSYGGSPFGKNAGNTIYVGQAYAGWTNGDFTFTAGRLANPFTYGQTFIWSDDVNPEGLAEQWKHNFGAFSLFANLGQFAYNNNGGATNTWGNAAGIHGTYMLGQQIGGNLKFDGGRMYVQVAPAYYTYSNDGSHDGLVALKPPTATGNTTAGYQTAGLQVLDLPVDLGLPAIAGAVPVKIFGDFANNFGSHARAEAAGYKETGGNDKAWQLGAAFGQPKSKGDWELRAFYQSIDAFALDPNIINTTELDAHTNMKGFTVMGTYVIINGVSVKLSYFNGQRKDAALPTYGYGNFNTTDLGKYSVLRADLLLKF